MKALFLEGKQQLSLKQVAAPIPKKDEILLTIEATGIGGSEYLGFNNPGIRPLPNIMGHGFVGTTTAGKRVAVNPLIGCGDCNYCANNLAQLCADWKMIGVKVLLPFFHPQ